MRIAAECLLGAWSVLNLVLAFLSRRTADVAAIFAAAAVLTAIGLLTGNLAVLLVGLLSSLAGPFRYGQQVAGENRPSHHLVRGLVIVTLAVLYVLS